MLNKLESREAKYTGGMNARQPWNDVNVINITFRDRRCIDELAFRVLPFYLCTCTSCKVFTCVNCVNVLRGPPSELSGMVRPFPAQFAIPEGTADLIKSHGSGPTPIYGVCLIVHNERSNVPFSPSATQGLRDSVSMPRACVHGKRSRSVGSEADLLPCTTVYLQSNSQVTSINS